MSEENFSKIDDKTLTIHFVCRTHNDAEELHSLLGRSLIEMIQQRDNQFTHSEPVYFTLHLLEAFFNKNNH